MGWTEGSARHREGVLKLLSRLKSQSVKVDMVGVQSHIGPGLIGDVMGNLSFDANEQASLKSFLDAVTAMGHRLSITEFDVGETGLPPDNRVRDEALRLAGIRNTQDRQPSGDGAGEGLAGEGPRGKG